MLPNELDDLLKEWRYAYMGDPPPLRPLNDDDRRTGPGNNPISRSLAFAPKTKDKANRKLAGRDGSSRRRLMAARSGVANLRIVPEHFVDPIRCTEKRGMYLRVAEALPAQVQKIDRAAMALYKVDQVKGLVLRFEYLSLGTQREKAEQIAAITGKPLLLRMYRLHLEQARFWLAGRMAA